MGVKMANGKTFVRITNQQVYEKVTNMDENNEKAHEGIMAGQEKLRVCLNDHLHEHKIKRDDYIQREQEKEKQQNKERWMWGIIVTIVGIASGVIGSLL
jgi:hypothetical protein